MGKIIDLNKPINELCQEYPEMVNIMKELGFESITNPTMLKTVGRLMTLTKGAKMKNMTYQRLKKTS